MVFPAPKTQGKEFNQTGVLAPTIYKNPEITHIIVIKVLGLFLALLKHTGGMHLNSVKNIFK